MTDKITNLDFKTESILGWFWNGEDKSIGIGSINNPVFGMLTAVKHDGKFEEHYGHRWNHFRPATKKEVLERCYYD